MSTEKRLERAREELAKLNDDEFSEEMVFNFQTRGEQLNKFKNDEIIEEVGFNIETGSLETMIIRKSDILKSKLMDVYKDQLFIKNQFQNDNDKKIHYSTLSNSILYVNNKNEFLFNLKLSLFKEYDEAHAYSERNIFNAIHLNDNFESEITSGDPNSMYSHSVSYLGAIFTNYPTAAKFRDLALQLKQLIS